ncbi:MAG: DNA adenine methylase [Acidobacteriota bacterium]|nr:DNA adenine methylase [Blastocatellia bacterium]MDW8411580.1 DNA adenine methylase [Acidobacteriota bacterium]
MLQLNCKETERSAKAFVRYPGGKRRLLVFLRRCLPAVEDIDGKYIEPFVGSGAVFFYLRPKRAVLSDINPELIDLYRAIRYAPRQVWAVYKEFGNTKTDYYLVRDKYTPKALVEKAARTLYLNRTCFKGMWRHNREGRFNVGYGGQQRRWVINQEDLVYYSSALRGVELECADFQLLIDRAQEGDFIFADPPYRPGCRECLHSHYVWHQFKYHDYQRLAECLQSAKSRGVRWLMTISSHEDIICLLKGNYALRIPRGTGKMPGILTADSGEVIVSSYLIEGSARL